MSNILDEIVAYKFKEVEARKKTKPLKSFVNKIDTSKNISFIDKLNKNFCIIGEIKKGSPSKGIIRKNFHPLSIARNYIESNIDAISILTDEKFFYGKISYLNKIGKFSVVPLLRKDFIIDEYQIYESKFHGANIILLIAAILSVKQLKNFLKLAEELNLEVLTEVHNKSELNKVLKTSAKIIGINNRNLKTFNVDIKNSLNLVKYIPDDRFRISESGINSVDDIKILKQKGINGVLIGEAFMREENIKNKVKELKNG